MKKIISLGIASAVLALTAISASAAVVVKTDTAKVNPNATITVEFSLDADASGFQFDIAPVGLTLVADSSVAENPTVSNASGINVATCNGTRYLTTGGFKAGEVFLKQTYTVTAAEGEAVALNITNAENLTGAGENLTAVVVAASSDSGNTSDSGSDSGNTSDSGSDSGNTSDSGSGSGSGSGDNDNPNSGVALAVFPAIIAGAAVVVAKKRK